MHMKSAGLVAKLLVLWQHTLGWLRSSVCIDNNTRAWSSNVTVLFLEDEDRPVGRGGLDELPFQA